VDPWRRHPIQNRDPWPSRRDLRINPDHRIGKSSDERAGTGLLDDDGSAAGLRSRGRATPLAIRRRSLAKGAPAPFASLRCAPVGYRISSTLHRAYSSNRSHSGSRGATCQASDSQFLQKPSGRFTGRAGGVALRRPA
jgi:hypothetical protein